MSVHFVRVSKHALAMITYALLVLTFTNKRLGCKKKVDTVYIASIFQ